MAPLFPVFRHHLGDHGVSLRALEDVYKRQLRARVAAHLRREKREHHSTLSFDPDIRFDLSAKVLYLSLIHISQPDAAFRLAGSCHAAE